MDYPGQMAIGPGGDLYVADQQGTIDVFNPNSGSVLNQFGSSNLTTPSGLAFSPSGDLYVSDFNGGNGVVDEFDGSGNFIAQVIGPSAGLDYPNAMTFGPDGNLYIADSGSGSIYEYNITSTAFSVFASDTSANVNLVFGPGGNLYVVLASGGVDEFNGTTGALIGPFGDTFTATGADIEGMAFGADGNLYLADSNGVDVVDGSTGDVTGNFIAVDGVDVINPTFLTFGPSVPEPATFLPGALGLMLLGWLRLRGRNLQRKGEGR
jgi:DNA-binding beta-propeller fold protein YncE